MKKSVLAAVPAVALLSLAACADEPAEDTAPVEMTAEEDEVEVDMPDIPAEDVAVPVDEATDGDTTAEDEAMPEDGMADDSAVDPEL